MGNKTFGANAIFIDDQANFRGMTVKLDRISSDAELPTVRHVLAKVGIQPTLYPIDPQSQLVDGGFYAWDGGDNLIDNIDRQVIRGENLRWGPPNNSASTCL